MDERLREYLDREAEAWLTPRLAALVPGSRVVGEEAVEADPSLLEGLEGGVAWLLDPVDGTSNFARGEARSASRRRRRTRASGRCTCSTTFTT